MGPNTTAPARLVPSWFKALAILATALMALTLWWGTAFAAPTITTVTLPNGTYGTAYSQTSPTCR